MKKFALVILFLLSAILSQTISIFAQTPPANSWLHSCFVFRDMNRNGVFDMGDRPYTGLTIKIGRPDGSKATTNSNLNGFANFALAFGDDENAEIYEAGTYKFEAVFPKGWQPTTPTSKQEYKVVVQSNAGGIIVPAKPCIHIGVAPTLAITGSFAPKSGQEVGDYKVVLTGPDGDKFNAAVDDQGKFSMAGKIGDWNLEISDKSGANVYSRQFKIQHAAVSLSHIDLAKEIKPQVDTELKELSFDDLLISDSLFEIPSGYGGLNWGYWISTHYRLYGGRGYVNSTISSEYLAYNSSGVYAYIWSEKPFDFVGAYMGVAWPRGEEDDVLIQAWRNDELVYEDRLRLSTYGPLYFSADYRQITRLGITHGNHERVVFDNFQYRTGD